MDQGNKSCTWFAVFAFCASMVAFWCSCLSSLTPSSFLTFATIARQCTEGCPRSGKAPQSSEARWFPDEHHASGHGRQWHLAMGWGWSLSDLRFSLAETSWEDAWQPCERMHCEFCKCWVRHVFGKRCDLDFLPNNVEYLESSWNEDNLTSILRDLLTLNQYSYLVSSDSLFSTPCALSLAAWRGSKDQWSKVSQSLPYLCLQFRTLRTSLDSCKTECKCSSVLFTERSHCLLFVQWYITTADSRYLLY